VFSAFIVAGCKEKSQDESKCKADDPFACDADVPQPELQVPKPAPDPASGSRPDPEPVRVLGRMSDLGPVTVSDVRTRPPQPLDSPSPVQSGGDVPTNDVSAGISGPAEVRFESNPPGATIVLRQRNKVVTAQTPHTFKVPVGVYSWSVSKVGFLPDSSASGGLKLVAASRTITLQLTGASDWSAISDRADAAFRDGRCAEAIGLYTSLETPRDRNSKLYERWVISRMQLARCYSRVNDANGAVEVLKTVRDESPGNVNWRVVFELGVAQCGAGSFPEGRRTFIDLDGQIRNRVPVENKAALRALSHYGLAYCGYEDYDNRRTPPQSLADAIDEDFDRFFESAQRAIQEGTMSSDVRRLLDDAVRDGERFRKRVSGG